MKTIIVALSLLGIASPALATIQDSDILIYEGEKFSTPVFPLDYNWPIANGNTQFQILPNVWSSANYRGYVATWEVYNKKLYIVKIESWIAESDGSHRKATLELLFPGKVKNGRVPADWFSGTIFAPGYRWGDWLSKEDHKRKEADAQLVITVEKGRITKVEDRRTRNKAIDSGRAASP